MELLARIDRMGVIASAPARDPRQADFVSRFFAPSMGIPEDPVTGSSHCTLIPVLVAAVAEKEPARAAGVRPGRGAFLRGGG